MKNIARNKRNKRFKNNRHHVDNLVKFNYFKLNKYCKNTKINKILEFILWWVFLKF